MSKKQKTIQKEVSLSGVGLHTGNTVTMVIKPAPVNHGFAFSRVDLEGSPVIEASAESARPPKLLTFADALEFSIVKLCLKLCATLIICCIDYCLFHLYKCLCATTMNN